MKFITQEERAKAARIKDRSARPLRRKRYKPRSKFPDPLATYIKLKCGHVTTIEDIERYRAWQPKTSPLKYLCENCGKWIEQQLPERPAEIPDEPLF